MATKPTSKPINPKTGQIGERGQKSGYNNGRTIAQDQKPTTIQAVQPRRGSGSGTPPKES